MHLLSSYRLLLPFVCLTVYGEKEIVHRVQITNYKDMVFYANSVPCKVIRRYCESLKGELHYDTCFAQLYELSLKHFTDNWNRYKDQLKFSSSFLLSCKAFRKAPPSAPPSSPAQRPLEVTSRNSTQIVTDLYELLVSAANRNASALARFNQLRPQLKLTEKEKLELYEQAVLLLPRNLFVVDQFGLSLMGNGYSDLAKVLFENAVKMGLWGHPMQRPVSKYVASLPQEPWHDPKKYKFISKLEKGWKKIKEELSINLKENEHLFTEEAENLHAGGNWTELRLKSSGHGFTKACDYFPKTMKVIRGCGEEFTSIKFSAIQPGTHIRPHTGPTNERLRVHLALVHRGGARIRVNDKWHTWKEGKAIIFDDSWEHEVRNDGKEARVVLILDIWHPLLPEHQRIVH
ncbi:uncharacterized protein [Oscarella lobularis]|uniref:uncharacterized protein n=1 Tax=Oscarella lobularis TaxID=121494 RepID=UPI003313F8ED